MATANHTCECGRTFNQRPGRGRPRKRCTTCSPVKVAPKRVPRPSGPVACDTCGNTFPGKYGAKYCSVLCRYRANYETANRVPCTICGEPTGWKAGRVPTATHRACMTATFQHGTHKGYVTMKCRCAECRAWSKKTAREYRDKRRAEGRPISTHGHSGPYIPEKTRAAVYERDAWMCRLCDEPTQPDADPNSDWYPSLDHIKPQSAGGSHDITNLRTCHRWCNSVRGAHADLFTA